MSVMKLVRSVGLAGMAALCVTNAFAAPISTTDCPTVEQLQKFYIYYSGLDGFDTKSQKFTMSASLSEMKNPDIYGWLIGIEGAPVEHNDDLYENTTSILKLLEVQSTEPFRYIRHMFGKHYEAFACVYRVPGHDETKVIASYSPDGIGSQTPIKNNTPVF